MAMVRTLISWISGGALLGLFFASIIGPKWLGWYNSPGSVTGAQALCDVAEMTQRITSSLLRLQVEGAAAGGIVFLIIGIVFEVRRRKKQPPAAAATPA